MSIFYKLICPIVDCEFHYKMIKGPLSLLRSHIFRDHDYFEKLKTAFQLGLIQNLQEQRSPQWLADQIATKGTQ